MKFPRLNIVDLLGILAPGTLVWGAVLLAIVAIWEIWGDPDFLACAPESPCPLMDLLKKWQMFFMLIFFLGAYLFGMVLRLFDVDWVDNLGYRFRCWLAQYSESVRKGLGTGSDTDIISDNTFPYLSWVKKAFGKASAEELIALLERDCPEVRDAETEKDCRDFRHTGKQKTLFNRCKNVILMSAPDLYDNVAAAEAQTRFLAGTFCACVVIFAVAVFGFSIGIFSCVVFPLRHEPALTALYLFIALVNTPILLGILRYFIRLRRREATVVWDCYLLVHRRKAKLPSAGSAEP